MPAGFQVTNNSGSIQVDGAYRNLALRHKGLITSLPHSTFGTGYSTLRDYTITVPADYPVVAIAPASGSGIVGCRLHYMTRSGSNWTLHFYALTPPSGAEFFVFDTPQAVSGGYGLEVYTEAGQLAFSSLHKYMRVVGSPTQPAGRRYAVVEASPEASWYEDADPGDWNTFWVIRYNPFFYLNGSTISKYDEVTFSVYQGGCHIF